MSHKTRIALLAAFAALGLMAFGGASASAGTYTCSFDGLAGTANSDDPADGGVSSVQRDLEDNDLLDFDAGSYEFTGGGTCIHVDNDDGSDGTGVYTGTISSTGRYNNQICGTGTATSNAANGGSTSVTVEGSPTGNPLADAEGPVSDVDYHIDFTGGNGLLTINSATNANGETGGGAGYVNIHPSQGNCVNESVKEFLVSGSFTVDLS